MPHPQTVIEPRWPAVLAMLSTALIYASLPSELAIGPNWLLFLIVIALEIPTFALHRIGYHFLTQLLGYVVSAILTLFIMFSLAVLVINVPAHTQSPVRMLESAAALWLSNILIFSLWYWRLDAGGPIGRAKRPGHTDGAFLFPQMTWEPTRGKWSPRFIDYLFLAFTSSTALSPTDTPVLSRWAKILVMLQAMISLTTLALLGARAVNIM